MNYFEAELKVKMKPESTKAFINHVTLGFDHKPTKADIIATLADRYPQVDLVKVERVWNATHKAKELSEYYATHRYTGD